MIFFWFIVGAIVGSFLNVCIYRLPRGESIVYPASHCPQCGKTLAPLDLIPVISFLLLRGCCRLCQERISWRYPLVELLTALGFVFIWQLAAGNLLDFAAQIIFLSLLIIIFFADWEKQVIPDPVSYTGIIVGLIYNLFRGQIIAALLGTIFGYSLLFFIARLAKGWYKKEAMGEGDFYIAALLGANLGWHGMLLAVFLGYLIAAAFAVVWLVLKRIKMGDYIPFGPALAVGGLIALFWGERLLGWYFKVLS